MNAKVMWLMAVLALALGAPAVAAGGVPAVDIGSRRELFVDDALVDRWAGDARLELQRPVPHEVVLVTDRPWEGNTSAYFTVFQDGPRYRMYYRGSHFDEKTRRATHPEVTCYAESRDGIHWTRPELGLFEFGGSRQNNIVWAGPGTHNFTPFLDTNPHAPPEARYKALASGGPGRKHGLYAFQSPDGIRWKLMRDEPVITAGAFDSQNLAFWDAVRGQYRAYWRIFTEGVTTGGQWRPGGYRAIRTATSSDFLHWGPHADLAYADPRAEHLYTNAIRPYERAPHLFIGFPTRFHPERGEQVEPIFMSSRDGVHFRRFADPVIPVTAPQDRGGNRSNYMTWGLVRLPGDDRHWSVYATEAYYRGPAGRLRRFTYRLDGFVSVRASQGELVTKPLRFQGDQLSINYAAPQGEVRVEIQDAAGRPIEGYKESQSIALKGDAIHQTVRWQQGEDVGRLAGQPVRLRFVLRNADLYAFVFSKP